MPPTNMSLGECRALARIAERPRERSAVPEAVGVALKEKGFVKVILGQYVVTTKGQLELLRKAVWQRPAFPARIYRDRPLYFLEPGET